MDINENIKAWLTNDEVPQELKNEIKKMDETALKNAFFQEMQFGTAGLRGIIAPGPNSMNVLTVKRATIGYGLFIKKHYSYMEKPIVVIAHDNRHMHDEFTNIVAQTLNNMGINTIVFDSLRPTPLLSYAIKFFKAQGGVMITASHNPKEYNGYKVYDNNGCQLSTDNSMEVTKLIDDNNILPPYNEHIVENKGTNSIANHDVDDCFINDCKKVCLNPQEEKKIKVVFTPQHGCSAVLGVRILKELGYDVYPVEEQMVPDPDFGATQSPNPEKPEAYIKAIELAKKVGADLIVSTDPDADRCGIGYLSSNGEYVLQTGNQTGAALIQYILNERKKRNLIPSDNPVIIQSIVTASLGSRIAKSFGVNTIKVLTGFKYLAGKMEEISKDDPKRFQFAYEESYGYIVRDICRDKNSIESLAIISEMINHYYLKGLRLDQVMDKIYDEFGYTFNKNIELYFNSSEASAAGSKLDVLRKHMPTSLLGRKIIKVEDFKNQYSYNPSNPTEKEIMNTLPVENVLILHMEDGCFFAVRPSGTEPKIKFYYECRGTNREEVHSLPEKFHAEIAKIIG